MVPEVEYAVVVPVLNGGATWKQCIRALGTQLVQPAKVLVVDSGSSDGSDLVAQDAGFELIRIARDSFDHGGTRQMAARILWKVPLIVYLTQDAVLSAPDSMQNLLRVFRSREVGAAYGRQLPRIGSGPIEAHARMFNYPPQSERRSIHDAGRLGIKTAFMSDTFAAYRTDALFSVGGFPARVIQSEDMLVAAKLLLAGWSIGYAANACVYHSHSYSIRQEFRRYFDTGTLHRSQETLLKHFPQVQREGFRFVQSELEYLVRRRASMIPVALIRTLAKYAAYLLGKHYRHIPRPLRRVFSMQPSYWNGVARR